MSTQQYSNRPFTSHDGEDASGVRAEVLVTTGVGLVNEITVGGQGQSANIKVSVDSLKHKLSGWIKTDDPVFALLEEAKESGELISFRIESQRKAKVDRSTPLAELRKNMEVAKDNTTLIFAGAKKASSSEPILLTSEAVTSPSEDPQPGGRIPASTPRPSAPAATSTPVAPANVSTLDAAVKANLPREVVNALAGQLLASGANPESVRIALVGGSRAGSNDKPQPRIAFSREEPGWKMYNTDGRLNLGSAAVSAAVGAEQFVRKHLVERSVIQPVSFDDVDVNELVITISNAVLSAADSVQVSGYGEGYLVDRSVGSHTRARGIVYDTIESYVPYSANEDIADWAAKITTASVARFSLILSLVEVEESQPTHDVTPAPVQAEVSVPDYVFNENFDTTGELATEETIALLRDLAKENKVSNLNGLGTLIRITLGHALAKETPNEGLLNFIDFYASRDEEDLNQAIAWAVEVGK